MILSRESAPKNFIRAVSLRAERTVAGIAETRHDIGVLIELIVDRGGPDFHIGMGAADLIDTLARADQAHEANLFRAAFFQALDRRHGGVAGCQDRLADDDKR